MHGTRVQRQQQKRQQNNDELSTDSEIETCGLPVQSHSSPMSIYTRVELTEYVYVTQRTFQTE